MGGRVGKEPFDKLKGYRVIVWFENETKRESRINRTGRHRGFRSTFEGNVECILDLAIKVKETKLQ